MDDRQQRAKPSPAKVAMRAVASAAVVVVLALLIGWFDSQAVAQQQDARGSADATAKFVAEVLGNVGDEWKVVLGNRYRPAKLSVFARSAATRGCGRAWAAAGPFYCPDDETIYLGSSFFTQLKTRACRQPGEACEFARAYIIAHEFGHHVQKLLGTLDRVEAEPVHEGASGPAVRAELQADCFAGIWAARTRTKWKNVTPAMIAAATEAAQFAGDDDVPPWAMTHGTANQRGAWFMRGYEGKSLARCNSFAARRLANSPRPAAVDTDSDKALLEIVLAQLTPAALNSDSRVGGTAHVLSERVCSDR